MKQLFFRLYKHVGLFIVIAVIGLYIINKIGTDKQNRYLQMQAELLQTKYDTNYKYFKIMSKDIFMMYSDNKPLINLLKQAKDADVQKKARLREAMYNLLKKRYKRLENMGVAQLHFHLSDKSIFLQMNEPYKFTNYPKTTKPNATNKGDTQYFDEGFRIGGFRFAYPLYDTEKKYIGSFEISFSSKKLLENIQDNFTNDIHLLVSKSLLDKRRLQENQKMLYEPSWESSNFMIEKSTHKTAGDINLYKIIQSDETAKEIAYQMQNKNAFAITSTNNYEIIALSFVPIKNNYNDFIVAYLVTYTEADYLDNVKLETYYLKALFFVVVFLLFLFGIYMLSNKEKLREMAHFDNLTKLPNRSFFYTIFESEIYKAIRHKKKLGLLFIDLDGFKSVNDTYGHNVGDELLIKVAHRLKDSLRVTDTVARLGGDEFTIILTDIKHKKEILIVAEKIILVLNKDFIINKNIINIGASIGVSIYPDHGKTIDILMQNADNMMYEAKNAGKNRVKIFKEIEE